MDGVAQLFGQVVRRRRVDLGLSQEEYAARAHVHRTYVSSIEHGKVAISIRVAHQLALALNTKLSDMCQELERRLEQGGSA